MIPPPVDELEELVEPLVEPLPFVAPADALAEPDPPVVDAEEEGLPFAAVVVPLAAEADEPETPVEVPDDAVATADDVDDAVSDDEELVDADAPPPPLAVPETWSGLPPASSWEVSWLGQPSQDASRTTRKRATRAIHGAE